MQILFEKSHPKDLVDALSLIHKADNNKKYSLSFYDKSIDEKKLKEPILFLFDYSKKGFEITTEKLYESGYRVFALKTKKNEKLDFFELSLTVIGLWPKVIKILKENNSPFIYSYKYCGSKLVKVKIQRTLVDS